MDLPSDTPNFYIETLSVGEQNCCFLCKNKAQYDVEDNPDPEPNQTISIKNIANQILTKNLSQIIINIHGYNVRAKDARQWNTDICQYAADHPQFQNYLFFGYRWPSENRRELGDFPLVDRNKLLSAFEALPTLLLGILITGIILGLTSLFLTAIILGTKQSIASSWWYIALITLIVSIALSIGLRKIGNAENVLPFVPPLLILAITATAFSAITSWLSGKENLGWLRAFMLLVPLVFSLAFFSIILALILLRLSTYLRDRQRGSSYGIIDLFEFLRQLDKEVFDLACQNKVDDQEKQQILGIDDPKIGQSRIKLSFIAHSLGCEVATQTIRILSDVFDPAAVEGNPSSKLGHIFQLERLVLVAPDIPVESILSGRTNVLKSSLRRCKEAYIFCSEADLALRGASTAANYMGFPAKTRRRGYKLGNIAAKHFFKNRSFQPKYGICNVESNHFIFPFNHLELRSSDQEYWTLEELAKNQQKLRLNHFQEAEEVQIANKFTYFDCTDYKDLVIRKQERENDQRVKIAGGIVSFAEQKQALNFFWDYIKLTLRPGYIDVHGGYFDGLFSRKLIYGLAFLGFEDLLNFNQWHKSFSRDCQDKQIQVIIAKAHYDYLTQSKEVNHDID